MRIVYLAKHNRHSDAVLAVLVGNDPYCLSSPWLTTSGHSLALEFRNKGARVFATARSANTLSDLAAKDIETLSLEVDRSDSIATCVDEIKKRTGGKLDYLVNNAGGLYGANFDSSTFVL